MTLTVGQTASRSLTLTSEHVRLYSEITGDRKEAIHIGPLTPDGEQLLTRVGETVVTRWAPSVADRLAPIGGRFASLDVWSAHQPSEVIRVEAEASGAKRTSKDASKGAKAGAKTGTRSAKRSAAGSKGGRKGAKKRR